METYKGKQNDMSQADAKSYYAPANIGNDGTFINASSLTYDGLQPIIHTNSPAETGYPIYFHQPIYYNGDDVLYSQQDNSNVEVSDGNGIKIYCYKTSFDPGQFTVDSANANYKLINTEWMDANGVSSLQSYMDMVILFGNATLKQMRTVNLPLWHRMKKQQ
eukprot:6204929-Ditylum_brightwellii.AAC.1